MFLQMVEVRAIMSAQPEVADGDIRALVSQSDCSALPSANHVQKQGYRRSSHGSRSGYK